MTVLAAADPTRIGGRHALAASPVRSMIGRFDSSDANSYTVKVLPIRAPGVKVAGTECSPLMMPML
jgi:hypothetical protein